MSSHTVAIIVFGLLLHSWTNCNIQAQLFRNGFFGRGSQSNSNSAAYSRNVGIGNLIDLDTSRTRSQSITQQQNGATNIAKSGSVSKGVSIGDFDVSSTLSRSKSYSTQNGVSRGVEHDLNVGNLGFGTSLSSANKGDGFGLQRNNNGLTLDLGLLEFDLTRNNKNAAAGSQAQTNAGAFANGAGAQTNVQSQSNSNSRDFGLLDISSSRSQSQANAISRNGPTGTYANGQANGAQSGANTFGGFLGRFKRQGFFFPGALQRGNQGQRPRPGFGGGSGGGFGGRRSPQQFEQQSAANTQNMVQKNANGIFQNNAGSSQGSNLASDGSSGQLSSANTMQQNFQAGKKSGSKNSAQSQSLNFNKHNIDASSSNADTSHSRGPNSEVVEANSGSMVNQQNQFGSASNTAQTNTKSFNENGVRGSQSSGQSQSIVTGKNGGASGSNSGSESQVSRGPNGFINSSSSASSSSFNNGRGGQTGTSSSSQSGCGGGGATSSANSNAFSGGGFQQLGQFAPFGGFRGRPQPVFEAHSLSEIRYYRLNTLQENKLKSSKIANKVIITQQLVEQDQFANGTIGYQVQARTFDVIFGAILSLISPSTTIIPPCILFPCNPPFPPPCGAFPCGPPLQPVPPIPPPIPRPIGPPGPIPIPPPFPPARYPCTFPCYRPYPIYPPVITGGFFPFTTTQSSIFNIFGSNTQTPPLIYPPGIGGIYGQGVGQFPFGYYRGSSRNSRYNFSSAEMIHPTTAKMRI